ncbi:MAG TPA: OB-fold nucleic acid binding domain-containing protein, partial [Candidatus Nanoarchaeia archaeon]|nr:OB-fold nucleic acid binding domain-containing protein [Candidatus Nanoarchaeia archaeon]
MEAVEQKKKSLVRLLLDRNILIEPEFLQQLNSTNDPAIISALINEKLGAQPEPTVIEQPIQKIEVKSITPAIRRDGVVKVGYSYVPEKRKIVVQDFITYFTSRYNIIKKILQQRTQLENITSIGKLKAKNEREAVSVIGMVYEKEDTKNGIMVTIEDPTGSIKVYFSKNKQEIAAKAQDIIHDEVIGITGSMGKNIIFANDAFFPDIPMTKELKKSPDEEYAVFISDLHVGSKQFL